jgi:hypothetical protein
MGILSSREKNTLRIVSIDSELYDRMLRNLGYGRTTLRTSPALDKELSDLTFDLSVHELDLSSIIPEGASRAEFRIQFSAPEVQSFSIARRTYTGILDFTSVQSYMISPTVWFAISFPNVVCSSDRIFAYFGTSGIWTDFFLTVVGWEI